MNSEKDLQNDRDNTLTKQATNSQSPFSSRGNLNNRFDTKSTASGMILHRETLVPNDINKIPPVKKPRIMSSRVNSNVSKSRMGLIYVKQEN